jgi:hypothetical protein
MTHLSRLLVAATITTLGCSSSSEQECEVALDALGAGCPATFDGTPAGLPACGQGPVTYRASQCGDLISLDKLGGYFSSYCYYDATSHQLVGAMAQNDVPSYCDGTSFTATAGLTTSCTGEPLATKDCSSQL